MYRLARSPGREKKSSLPHSPSHLPPASNATSVGDPLDLGEVVGDEDHRETQPVIQIRDQLLYPAPRGLIEGARRFVEQERLRAEGEDAGDGDALLLPYGEGLRVAFR